MKKSHIILMSAVLATISFQGQQVSAAEGSDSGVNAPQITKTASTEEQADAQNTAVSSSPIVEKTASENSVQPEAVVPASVQVASLKAEDGPKAASIVSYEQATPAAKAAERTTPVADKSALRSGQVEVKTATGQTEVKTATDKKLSIKELAPSLNNPKVTIDDPTIAKVSGGIVSFLKAGKVSLTLTDATGTEEGLLIEVKEAQADEFKNMRDAWQDIIVGDRYYQTGNSQMDKMRAAQDNKVQNLWGTMHTEPGRQDLWASGPALTSSASLTTAFRNLQSMAIAFVDPASRYYQNTDLLHDILDGYNWMLVNKYSPTVKTYGNWWDWEIGAPRAVNDIAIVLYPYLTQEQIDAGVASVQRFVPDPNMHRGSVNPALEIEVTGANQVDISKVKILQGVLDKNSNTVKAAVTALEKVFPLVTSGEGFYSDGTFLQHTDVGYNGSYGNVLLTGVGQLMAVVQNTPYAISQSSLDNVQFWVEKGFAPFVYKGNLMDMVRGRAISRGDFQSNISADELIRAIVNVSQTMPEAQRLNYQQMVKGWLSEGNNLETYLSKVSNYRDLALIRGIMDNKDIPALDPQKTTLLNFPHMDKVVYRNNEGDFAVGLSMSSKRTKRYEAMNNENIHGWYTGDGMLYVYNGDLDQYNDDFWATVDPTLLPGTTETTKPQADGSGSNVTRDTFVGGATLGTNGAYAMRFSNNDGDLTANKSWFMVGDHVVALGSAIANNSGAAANTVIENRKLQDGKTYKVYVNGKLLNLQMGDSKMLENVTSIYLEAETPGASIGYKFLTPQKLTLNLLQRSGAWSDINKAQSNQVVTKSYFQILKAHVDRDDTYNYVLYPNISQTKFNKEAKTKILANDQNVQAVADENGYTGINVYNTTNRDIAGVHVTTPISIVRQVTGNKVNFAFNDPTQLAPQALTFSFKDADYRLVSEDDAVKLVLKDGVWTVTVSEAAKGDQTFNFALEKKTPDVTPEPGEQGGSNGGHNQQTDLNEGGNKKDQNVAGTNQKDVNKNSQHKGKNLPQTGERQSVGATLAGWAILFAGLIGGMIAKFKRHDA